MTVAQALPEGQHAGPEAKIGPAAIPVFFSYGFRPFFLLAGVYAVLPVLAWLVWLLIHLLGGAPRALTTSFPALLWHGHEMLFGYVPAVMAGFFLTAMPNWTGTKPMHGAPLMMLVALWVAGRLVMWFGVALPGTVVAAVDLAFLPVLLLVVTVTLLRAGNRRNLVLAAILAAMIAGNAMVHLEVLGVVEDVARPGLVLGADAVALLLAIIGGRIIPAFTRTALDSGGAQNLGAAPWLDGLAIFSVAAVLLADALFPGTPVVAAAAAAAILNGARLVRWRGLATRRQPILWILHLGFFWLVVAFALKAAAAAEMFAPSAALHALTIGAIGSLTLGVMSRAALGHSGRPLVAPSPLALAYVLVSLAALARILGPVLLPALYMQAVLAAGVLWAIAFALFVAVYTPILLRPRVDGLP